MKNLDRHTSGRMSAIAFAVISMWLGFSATAAAQAQAPFVYAASRYTAGSSITLYSVDPGTGSLIEVSETSLHHATSAYCLGINPSQTLLYVCDHSGAGIWGFSVDPGSGTLTPLAGSPYPSYAISLVVDPTGTFAVTAEGSGSVATYRIDPNSGDLTLASQVQSASAYDVVIEPSGRFVYVPNANSNTVSAFALDAGTGQLVPVPGSPFSAGQHPTRVLVDPSGSYLYVTNGNGSSLSAYSIDSASGALTPVPGSPFLTGPSPLAIAVDPTDSYVYVSSYYGTIYGFSIDWSSGTLWPLDGSPFPSGDSTPFGLAVDPSGQFIYAVDAETYELAVLALDPTTGQLSVSSTTPVTPVPYLVALLHP